MRYALVSLLVFIVCIPFAVITTLCLMPLWSWIESTYAIESVGHSGPAGWCFIAVFAAMVCGTLALLFAFRRRLSSL